ncbi:MAG: LysR substrate-binding domain-containing protein [Rhizobiaceae bacterium]
MQHSQLRSFHAVATEGGFTAAARSINVGQPTISTQIKALEDAYGVTLFHRQGHKVMLSDCGKELLKISQRIFSREDEARELLANFNELQTGLLRVGAVGPYHATPMLAQFHRHYPGISLSVTLGNSMEMVEHLLNYTVDVAVLAHIADNPAIYAIPFSRHPVVVFVNNAHPFANKNEISIEELRGQRFVQREKGSTTRLAFETAMRGAGIEYETVVEIGSREAVWSAVEQGLGIGVVSEIEFTAHENLTAVRISNADIYTTAHVACLADRSDAKIIKTFFDIAETIKKDF